MRITGDFMFREIMLWADNTFGKKRSNKMILTHLAEELNELAIAIDNKDKGFDEDQEFMYELADMQILLWNLTANNGACFDKLMDYCFAKHQKNVKRKWVLVDGKMKHLPDDIEIID